MSKLKSLIKKLDGKKTVIASIYWSIFGVLQTVQPEVVENPIVIKIGLVLSALGLGHKSVKGILAKK